MYLEENLERLNTQFNHLGIGFERHNGIIKLKQADKFLINEFPQLKENLKKKFGLTYNNKHNWHFGKKGEKLLKIKKIKTNPSRTQMELAIKLRDYVREIKEIRLKNSIINLLKKYKIFFWIPASKIMHHDYRYGLLEHTIQTIEIALAINSILKIKANKDLLIAGAIMHDIGKINCYKLHNGIVDITDIFLEQEHIVNGIKIISQEIKSEKLDDLIHIVASHHNFKEWGSPIQPISEEAWIIHFADNISGKIG